MRQLEETLIKGGSSGLKLSKDKKFQPVEDMNVATALKMEVVRLTAANDILKHKLEEHGVPVSSLIFCNSRNILQVII